ncbi:MAG: serine hydrolase domain-containing protein [Ilumatobacteraceae bacterium]
MGFKCPRHSLIAIGAALAGALSSIGCSGSSTSSSAIEGPESSPSTTVAELTSVDVSTTSLDPTITTSEETTTTMVVDGIGGRLTAVMDDFLALTQAPGVTMTVLRPAADGTDAIEVINLARGVRNMTTGAELSASDYFRWASITKPMTSTVVLQLVEEGLIDLEATVSTYLGSGWASGYELDGVDYGDAITIRQILDHTDGFADFAFDLGFYVLASTRLDTPFEPEEVIDWAVAQGPLYEPGTAYEYSTVGFIVAGLVIEEVTGNPAHIELRNRLFNPADAREIYLPPEESPPEQTINGYVQGDLKLALNFVPGFAVYTAEATVGAFYDISVIPQEVLRSVGWTGGGIEARAEDLARVFRQQFTGALSDEMLTAFTTPSEFSDYGLGINVGKVDGYTVYSHGGGTPGFRSHAMYMPELDVTIAVSANLIQIEPDIGTLASDIAAVIIDNP